MTHDYKRHGTTTLFAALSVLDGTVIGRCMQRHRHREFIRFLNAVERQGPKPFVWTQSAKAILAKLDRLPVLSSSRRRLRDPDQRILRLSKITRGLM